DEYLFSIEDLGSDLNRMRANESGMFLIHRASLEVSRRSLDALARQTRHLILSCLYRLHIDGNLARDFHAEVGRATGHVRGVGTGNQGLCRRAAGIDTSPAKELALDHGDGLSRVGKTMSERRACLSGSDDNCVVALHWGTHRLCDDR